MVGAVGRQSGMERWAGKVALVTGASSGTGKEVARLLAGHGVKVVATARRLYSLQELEKETDGLVKGLPCDVRVEAQVKSVFDWAEQNWGPVSILFNNAGYISLQPLQTCDAEELKKIFDMNVVGLSLFAKEALRSMKKSKVTEGHIINVNSYLGHHQTSGIQGIAPYIASKNAVTVLTDSLRHELGSKNRSIKVTSLSSGLTDVELKSLNTLPDDVPRLKARDIAAAVMYILSTPPGINVTELTIMAVGDVFC